MLYSKVLFYLMFPIVGATLIAKAVYYPISNFTRTNFCYFDTYTYYWVGIYGQSLTFFMTVFRYICLYHEKKLLRWNIKPKVSLSMYFYKKIICTLIYLPPSLLDYFSIYDSIYLFFLHLSTLLGY